MVFGDISRVPVAVGLYWENRCDDTWVCVCEQICPVDHTATDWRIWPTPGVETKETQPTSVRTLVAMVTARTFQKLLENKSVPLH